MTAKAKKVNTILIVAQLLLVYSIITKWLEFGCIKGNWVYPYTVKNIGYSPLIIFLVLTPIILILVQLSLKQIQSQKAGLLLPFWVVIGTLFQIILRIPYPFSLHDIITSDVSNSYYTPTLHYTAYEFLKQFAAITHQLPLHAKSNMPGKVLFYYFLRIITNDPQIMGYLIMLFSNAGGVFVYYIAKKMLGSKEFAFQAFILYLFIPAKIFFFPILNTVSPFFILLDLFLFLTFLEDLTKKYVFLLGMLLYVTFLFDPLPMASGILFMGILIRYLLEKKIDWKQVIVMILYVVLGFLFFYLILLLLFNFDIIRTFLYILKDAAGFNVRANRGYTIWIFHNLKEFIVTAGFPLSLLFIFNISYLIPIYGSGKAKGKEGEKQSLLERGNVIAASLFFLLIIIDLLGINRGEITRLWIFMASYLPIIAVNYLSRFDGKSTFHICLGGLLLQAVITISLVGFVIP